MEKEEIKTSNDSDSIVALAKGVFNKWLFSQIIVWLALLLFANSLFWNPIWWVVEQYFWLETTRTNNSYQLQLKTYEMLSWQVMTKIETIDWKLAQLEKRFDELEKRNSNLEERMSRIEDGMQWLYQTFNLKRTY